MDSRVADGRTTVFHDILNSKLPEHEKTMGRLATEGGAVVGAGTVSTSWTLTTAVFYLLDDEQCLQKLKQELTDAWPRIAEGETTASKTVLPVLEHLPYLSAVIQEALRLSYGVASRLARIAPDEALTVYPDSDDNKNGHRTTWTIPPGTPVSMTQLLLLRDERIFPCASTFRPERWIDNPGLRRYQVAFCKGSRICLGKHLALAELYIMLATLFRSYGSRDVRMPEDVGFLELWETDASDVECAADGFMPVRKVGSKGVRCKLHSWDE